ncbi:MAG: hypothetical protein GX621_12445 [Pirellulaceae bacterium]|nr:hypothetical protein [Pirellulaceae bacterium]
MLDSGEILVHKFDDQGRVVLSVEPDGATHYTVYAENASGNALVLRFPHCDEYGVPRLPIQVSEADAAGRPVQAYAVDPSRAATTGNVPTGLSAGTDQGHYVSWTKYAYHPTSGSSLYVAFEFRGHHT